MPRQNPQRQNPGLTLVPRRPHRSPLALWHLLSLDAPTIAALWTYFVAQAAHITLRWTSPVAMFLAVWMLYAADRLLDARNHTDLEERHRFHHRHHRFFLAAIAIASILLASLLHTLTPTNLRLDAILASLLFAYFALIHIPTGNNLGLPKELAVGIFFPAAIFIPTIAQAPGLRPALAPAALLFAAVCTLNCLYLYAWEHTRPTSSAHWTTRFAARHLHHLTLLTILIAFPLMLLGNRPLALACALSATILARLHAQRARLSAIHLRAAADLALLTPLLLLPFTRILRP